MPLMANQLENHPSPYLALHADDPVDWRLWSQQTMDRARRESKLLFVSVGYFACHWCHVMQRESFSDPEIAARLNKHFLSVKVDRELNPVLDDRLMTFLQATTGRGGWPMNIVLTPEGYPVVGFTYLPSGQFAEVLDQLSEKWQKDRSTLADAAREVDILISAQLSNAEILEKDLVVADLASSFLETGMKYADVLGGGFGSTAKFPSVPQLLAMLKINRHVKDVAVDDFIRLTLDKMLHSGLHDEIGFGFFRYTVDPDWQTPHFEKMLYTNTQLVELYFLAAEIYQQEKYGQTARQTLDFIIEQMSAENGALITSLSAVDDKDIEGGYYLWQSEELGKVLSPEELELFEMTWGKIEPSLFEAGMLPIRHNPVTQKERLRKLESLRWKLQQHRKKTRQIPRDDKQLASLNGYALAVLSAAVKDSKYYAEPAGRIAAYLKKLWKKSQLEKGLDDHGKSLGAGSLGDYSAVTLGLLKWAEASGDKESAKIGRELLSASWEKFYDAKGWQPLETSLLPNPIFQKHLQDSPEPSAETLLLQATALYLSTEFNAILKQRLEFNLSRVTQGMLNDPFYYATLVAFAVERKTALEQVAENDTVD